MKSLLICPAERPGLAFLTRRLPVALQPFLGRSLLEHWVEHLAGLGASHVRVLDPVHPALTHSIIGSGARWGLKVEIVAENRELTSAMAREKYHGRTEADWLAAPNDAILLDHFPGLPHCPLLGDCAEWFAALQAALPLAAAAHRIGVREIKPGVWIHLRSRIASTAQLRAPCWIGESARIGPRAIVGPATIVEDRAWVGPDSRISTSLVGPQTFVGRFVELTDSMAWSDRVLNWKTGTSAAVEEPYVLCALGPEPLLPQRAQASPGPVQDKGELQVFWKQLFAPKGS